MKVTFKYRLQPTKSQQHKLTQTLELCRFVYNQTLATRKDAYEQRGETLSYYTTTKLLPGWKTDKPELSNVHSQVLQNTMTRIDLAFQAFFRRVKAGDKPGYPRFKGRMYYDSFTCPQYGNGVKLDGDVLTLSKIGAVKVKLHRPVQGTIKTITIRRSDGKWYACFSCEVEPKPLPTNAKSVGIDLGLKTFAVLSDGTKIKRQRWMKRDADDVARLQRKKEHFDKGTPKRLEVLHALNHAYQRATNRRTNFAHQESRKLVNNYQFMVFEKLNIPDMLSDDNRVIHRNIADVAWGQFVQYTTYKAESAGRAVLFVNPRGTTQECSRCGEVVPKDLSVRIHDCPYCGLRMDRDLNASLNILARGLASIGPRPVEAPGFSHGE